MGTAVTRSVDLPAEPAVVWRALTDGDELATWFGTPVEVDAHPGGQVLVRTGTRRRRAVIVHFEPERQLTFRWLPERHPVGFVWPPDETPAGEGGEVTFVLRAVPGGTHLTVEEIAPVAGFDTQAQLPSITLPAGYVARLGGRSLRVCV